MPKTRYIFRLSWAFMLRFKEIIFGSIVFGFILFLTLRLLLPAIMNRSTETIAMVGRHSTSDLPTSVLSMIGEGLTYLDESGVPQPALAESWEAQDSGKVWKFTLKQGLLWQDETPVTSDSLKFSFEDVTIDRPDQRTIIFKLQNPFSPFPVVVSKPTFKKGLLGTGEWEVKQLSVKGSIVERLMLTKGGSETKIIKFYPTEERAKLAFKLGEVDSIEDIIDPSPLHKWNTVSLAEKTNTSRFSAVFFNVEDDLLSNKELRQALSYAINKEALGDSRVIGPIPPSSWAYNSQAKPYDYSVEKAKERIEEADLSEEIEEKLSITLLTIPILLPIAEKIAKDWEAVGFKTTLSVSSVLPQNYQAFLTFYDVPRDPDQYATWHSTQDESNITNYFSPRVDKLLEDGRLELDFEKRKAIYLDFQRFLLEDAPAAFLFHPKLSTIKRQ